MSMVQHRHGGVVPCLDTFTQGPCQGVDWREVMSWYPTEGIICGVISLARDRVQLEPKDMGNDGWPRWHWDPGGSIGGRMGQRVVWDLGIEGSIHDWVVRMHEVIQWFVWDLDIGV